MYSLPCVCTIVCRLRAVGIEPDGTGDESHVLVVTSSTPRVDCAAVLASCPPCTKILVPTHSIAWYEREPGPLPSALYGFHVSADVSYL